MTLEKFPYLRMMADVKYSQPMPDEKRIGTLVDDDQGNIWKITGFMLDATAFEEADHVSWTPKYELVTKGVGQPDITPPVTTIQTDVDYFHLGDTKSRYRVIGFAYNPLSQASDKWLVLYTQEYDGAYPKGTIWHRSMPDFTGATSSGQPKFVLARSETHQ